MDSLRDKFDKENLYEIILNAPCQFQQAFAETNVKLKEKTEKIIFCGMGGSGTPANLLKTFLETNKINFNIPILINRGYSIPAIVDSSWSGFFDSYSGNTEETLSCLNEAEKIGLKEYLILTRGGRLRELAEKNGYQRVNLPDTKQPRMSYCYVIGALLKILADSNLITFDFNALNDDVEKVLALQGEMEKHGQELAKSLQGKIPVVYASTVWESLAMIWKINLNENAKVPSFWNVFPELNHNEMVGYTNIFGDYKILILQDPDDLPAINKRMSVFKNILDAKLDIEIIEMRNGSPFFKLLTTLILGLWTSYYLALLNETDPTPVDVVEKFKRLLK